MDGKVVIGLQGNSIVADIPWKFRGRHKSIPGAKANWNKSVTPNKFLYWSFPLSMMTCRAFRTEFGDDLEIRPNLANWAWDQRRTEESLETLRAGGAADLPHVRQEAPKLWAALQTRPFQITGTAFIVKGERVCLGDEPRLGKTYQALAAIVEHGSERVLISCPKTATRSVWARKISELLDEVAYVAQGDRSVRERVIKEFDAATGPRFLIINNEMMRIVRKYRCLINKNGEPTTFVLQGQPENRIRPGKKGGCQEDHQHRTVEYPEYPRLFEGEPFDAIVIDESHNALASSKHQISDNIPQIRLGAVRLPIAEGGLKIASSGTPWRSRLDRAWGTLNWTRPDLFGSYWKFAEQYFGTTPGWGMSKIVNRELRDETAWNAMLRPYYLARTKAEVAPQLKPIEYAGTPPTGNPDGPVGVYIELDEKQRKAYEQIERDGLARLADGSTVMANGVLAEITRFKQFATCYGKMDREGNFTPILPSSKLDWILDFLEERRELDGKVVIASQYTKIVNLFTNEIRKAKWEVVTITGETTGIQRDHAQDAFMYGSPRVALINMFAGGEAIDLSAADEMIIIDEPWTRHVIEQTENRIQNLAKRNQLTIYRLRGEGTMDEEIAGLTEEQRAQLMAGKIDVLPQYAELVAQRT